MARFEIVVNGERRALDTEPDTPLLWTLRDSLGLTGTKFGCGAGICGACTVLEGTTALRSCQLSIAQAAGRSFTTIEGLSPDGSHPCQRAWLQAQVSHCGYCQPGMILEAVALLSRTRHPSDGDIDATLVDHVCRCGSYPRVRLAVHLAARLGGAR